MVAANGWQAQPQSRIMHTGSMCFQGCPCRWSLKMLDISGPLLPLSFLSLSHAQTRTQQSRHGAVHISQNTAQHLSRCQRDNGAACGARDGGTRDGQQAGREGAQRGAQGGGGLLFVSRFCLCASKAPTSFLNIRASLVLF